ncbi:putative polyamine:H+ symporter [Paratrimastix pyriformis]|uniref:Polyamine:H+ symporter n=1 Tax=Paratrimastix pyriformis TaxID=342808 RepID=A0ABQ8UD68_9EUKA|nr:putative polyamine:H+ symporter [Paratrimastix pyriformis]
MARIVGNIFGQVTYSCLAGEYLLPLILGYEGAETPPNWVPPLVRVGFVLICIIINIFGLSVVARCMMFLTIIVLSPFVILFAFAVPHLNWQALFSFSNLAPHPNYPVAFSVIAFALYGWDSASSFGSRVKKPQVDFPIGLFLALLLVIAQYIVPLVSCVSLGVEHPVDWVEGTVFVKAASAVGPWLSMFVSIAAAVGCFGLGIVFTASSSGALAASSELGFAPLLVAREWRECPIAALLLQGVVVLVMAAFLDFDTIVQLQMFTYTLALSLTMVTFVVVRLRPLVRQRKQKLATSPPPPLSINEADAFLSVPLDAPSSDPHATPPMLLPPGLGSLNADGGDVMFVSRSPPVSPAFTAVTTLNRPAELVGTPTTEQRSVMSEATVRVTTAEVREDLEEPLLDPAEREAAAAVEQIADVRADKSESKEPAAAPTAGSAALRLLSLSGGDGLLVGLGDLPRGDCNPVPPLACLQQVWLARIQPGPSGRVIGSLRAPLGAGAIFIFPCPPFPFVDFYFILSSE